VTIVEQGTSGAGATASARSDQGNDPPAFVKDVIEESKRQPVLIDFWAPCAAPAASSAGAGKSGPRCQGPR